MAKPIQYCKVINLQLKEINNILRWVNLITVRHFIFLGSKNTADSDLGHEIKRHLLLGRKAMTNLDCILKSRDIPLLTNVHS